jgi:hypothetical protein
MNCQHCVYYRYEPDTNFQYCIKPPFDLERMELEHCPDYYNKDDAKADAKYGGQDRY